MNDRRLHDDNNGGDEEEWEMRPLAPAEIRKMRRMMRDWDRYKYSWSLLGKIGLWAGGAILGMWSARDMFARFVQVFWPPSHRP